METGILTTIAFSLLSALASSFLAAYLTYRYTELSWRKRRHFEDIKVNCLEKILSDIERFEDLFRLSEGQISTWVRNETQFSKPPSSAWCTLFSFGFDKPPTTHYRLLLHDLKNHFPELVEKLKKFEEAMKEVCPLYNRLLYEVTKLVYSKASAVYSNIPGKDILTEAVVMTLAGYGEWDYPNNARFLKERGLYASVSKIVEDVKRGHSKLVEDFINTRNRGLSLVEDTKKSVLEILHSHKLPGKCNLY